MGQAHIRLGLLNARTALPSLDGLYFTLDFTGPKTVPTMTLDKALTLTVALESGDWELEVKGYSGHTENNLGSLVVRGTSSVSITAGISSPVAVYQTPDFSSGGTGTLSYNVSFPKSRAFLSLHPLSAQGTGQEINISDSAKGSITALSAGTYQAFIDLYDSTNNQATIWTGVVHIYDGSTTLLDQEFEAANFAACPPVVGKNKATLAEKLEDALASESGSHTINLDGTETVGSLLPFNVTGGKDITLTIRGNGQTVSLDSNGSILTLGADSSSSLTLILQDITLEGKDGNNAPVVQVNSGATLELEEGFLLTGNTSSTDGGGMVVSGGTVTMNGGKINGNKTSDSKNGGAVVVESGEFTMIGGEISGNTASGGSAHGGGVYVASGGKFTLSGDGKITGNSTSTSGDSGTKGGGGVFINGGTFDMSGGEVSGNSAGWDGGGVFVFGNTGKFTMSGGTISGNSAKFGGGVYVNGGGTVEMTGGVIYGSGAGDGNANTASSSGPALYKSNGTFTDSSGTSWVTTDLTIGTP
jgi:hypothetical protein